MLRNQRIKSQRRLPVEEEARHVAEEAAEAGLVGEVAELPAGAENPEGDAYTIPLFPGVVIQGEGIVQEPPVNGSQANRSISPAAHVPRDPCHRLDEAGKPVTGTNGHELIPIELRTVALQEHCPIAHVPEGNALLNEKMLMRVPRQEQSVEQRRPNEQINIARMSEQGF